MPKKPFKINDQDLAKFHEAVKGTRPLKSDKIPLSPRKPLKKPRSLPRQDSESLTINESLSLDPVRGEEFISFKQSGISHKILRNLRKGQYNVDATLDLHGFIVDEARTVVEDFLQQCLREQIRVVLIIHGKGHPGKMPILKNKLNHWLRELPSVLAFCSASRTHGSRGAIYVLLKRHTGAKP